MSFYDERACPFCTQRNIKSSHEDISREFVYENMIVEKIILGVIEVA